MLRWDNRLTVVNNPDENGGYRFKSFQWFRNGQPDGTEQSWSAGADGRHIDHMDFFRLDLTADNILGVLHTCEGHPPDH